MEEKVKQPYLKKLKEINGVKIWEVDGEYIRRNINEDFNNFGHHQNFDFIPKDEFWLDKERVPGEENYFINNFLTTRDLMARGLSYKQAYEQADAKEKKERSKSELVKKLKDKTIQKHIVPPDIYKKMFKVYSPHPLKTWLVDGELVRSLYFLDFSEGGHDLVYSFIPPNEVWVDDDLVAKERKFVVLHEWYERGLMSKGKNYDEAHNLALKIEYQARHFPSLAFLKIRRELSKNKPPKTKKIR